MIAHHPIGFLHTAAAEQHRFEDMISLQLPVKRFRLYFADIRRQRGFELLNGP